MYVPHVPHTCMCVYTHVCTYDTCMYCMYTYMTYIFIYTYMYIMCVAHTYMYIYTCTSGCTYIHNTCMYVCNV